MNKKQIELIELYDSIVKLWEAIWQTNFKVDELKEELKKLKK